MDNNVYRLILLFSLAVLLPIVITWLSSRRRIIETNRRADMVMAAMEKNPEVDIEALLRKVSPKEKLLKEKLLKKLLWGCLATLLGVGLIGFGIFLGENHLGGTDDPLSAICFGLISLGVGIAFLINYFVGKRMLAKEIEAEQQHLINRD